MSPPLKRSVALVMTRRGDAMGRVVGVLRPADPGDELAQLWGLPAATLEPGESEANAVQRIAVEKLGVRLVPPAILLVRGRQERPTYILEMALYAATTDQDPSLPPTERRRPDRTYYDDWRWVTPDAFGQAAFEGSLCTQLYLQHLRESAK